MGQGADTLNKALGYSPMANAAVTASIKPAIKPVITPVPLVSKQRGGYESMRRPMPDAKPGGHRGFKKALRGGIRQPNQ